VHRQRSFHSKPCIAEDGNAWNALVESAASAAIGVDADTFTVEDEAAKERNVLLKERDVLLKERDVLLMRDSKLCDRFSARFEAPN
jgi:hypothetical protein